MRCCRASTTNYDTDLMRALIEASAHATSVDPDGPKNVHHRGVIADHLRFHLFPDRGRGHALERRGAAMSCAESCAARCGMRIFWARRIR